MFPVDSSNRELLRKKVQATGLEIPLRDKAHSIVRRFDPQAPLPEDFVGTLELISTRLDSWIVEYQRRHPQRSLESCYAKVEDAFEPFEWLVNMWIEEIVREIGPR